MSDVIEKPRSRVRGWWATWWPLAVIVPASCLMPFLTDWVLDRVLPPKADIEPCDRIVGTLLNTRDPIELQRAGFLVQHMNCDVRSRFLAQPTGNP